MESSAIKDVERLKKLGYNAIARREQVPEKGFWYRVYAGPFSAHMEASLKAKELKNKKIVDYTAIKKKDTSIGSEIEKTPEKGTTPSPVDITISKVSLPKKEKVSRSETTVKAPSTRPTVSKPSEKAPTIKKTFLKSSEKTQPPKTPKKSSQMLFGFSEEGYGRNMGRGKVALGFRHTYQEIDPDIIKRTLTTSDGNTTTTQTVSIAGAENKRNTSMHMDSLYLRWGLMDWFEIFGNGGVSYNDTSDFNPVFGGGLRLNLFEVKEGSLRGFYGALHGEYWAGTVTYEYDSNVGRKWHKEADWEEIFAKGELGLLRSSLKGYVGVSYLDYREETTRRLLTNIPAPYISYVFDDELEENSYGAYGGVVINLSHSFLLNIEIQGLNKKAVFGSIEYQF